MDSILIESYRVEAEFTEDDDEASVLESAAETGRCDIVRAVLNTFDIERDRLVSAFHLAVTNAHDNVAKVILQTRIERFLETGVDQEGCTEDAAEYGTASILALLGDSLLRTNLQIYFELAVMADNIDTARHLMGLGQVSLPESAGDHIATIDALANAGFDAQSIMNMAFTTADPDLFRIAAKHGASISEEYSGLVAAIREHYGSRA